MKIFNHVFNTWVLAHFIHPIIYFLYFSFFNDEALGIGAIISLFVAALIVSLPSLFMSFLLMRFILRLNLSLILITIIWIFCAIGSILINVIILSFFLSDDLSLLNWWQLLVPSFIATVVSISVRFPLFQNLIRKNNLYEDRDETISSYGS